MASSQAQRRLRPLRDADSHAHALRPRQRSTRYIVAKTHEVRAGLCPLHTLTVSELPRDGPAERVSSRRGGRANVRPNYATTCRWRRDDRGERPLLGDRLLPRGAHTAAARAHSGTVAGRADYAPRAVVVAAKDQVLREGGKEAPD